MNQDTRRDLLDPRHAVGALLRRLPILIVLVILVFAVTFAVSSTRPDVYRATAKIRVVDPNSEAVFGGNQLRIDPKREVDTQLAMLRSHDTRRSVDERLGGQVSGIKSISATSVRGTDLIALSVTSGSPEFAQEAANAYAETYVELRRAQVTSGFTTRADDLRKKADEIDDQIADLDAKINSDPPKGDPEVLAAQRSNLVAQQADLMTRAIQFDVEATTRSGNVMIAESAFIPKHAVEPSPKRDASVAALLAGIVAIGGIVLWTRLDDRIHGIGDLEAAIDPVPLMGGIPVHAETKRGARHLPRKGEREIVERHSQAAEAYKSLRVALQFSALSKQLKTIAVTSASQGEGKSTVTANLAVALAETGLRVVVISADLRRPTISRMFDIDETGKGLTTVLREQVPLTDCMVPVDVADGRTLFLLPAGELPPNPAEVLGSDNMKQVIQSLVKAGADYVLIDTPPVLPVVDVLALSQLVDGVLVVAVANQTRRGDVDAALGRLAKVEADVVGVVLNGIPTARRLWGYGGYGYGGYGYGGYGYGRDDEHSDA